MLGMKKKSGKSNKAQQQATEKIFEDTYNAITDETEKFKSAMQEYVHLQVVDKPMKKLVAMLKLRDEMLQLSEEMNDRMKEILERFGEEAYDEDTGDGLLEVELPEYQSCYKIDIEKVQALLWKEEKRMRDELTAAENASERMQDEMATFMKENSGAMEKFLNTANSQIKVLAASNRQREELKEMLRTIGRYDAATEAYLTSAAAPAESAPEAAPAEEPKGLFGGGGFGLFGGK